MARSPGPLPEGMPPVLRTSATAARGIHVERLRRADIEHPYRGVVRVHPRADDSDPARERVREFSPLLRPGWFFSHSTALGLHGAPTPPEDRIHVSAKFPATPPRRPAVVGHSLQRADVVMLAGIGVSAPASAWVESGPLLTGEQLVVAGDALVTGARHLDAPQPARTTIGALRLELAQRARPSGARRLRWAVDRIRIGVDSPAETRLRLAIVGAGLPEPEVDATIRVSPTTVWHVDLAYLDRRILLEYEGDSHRARDRWMRDIARYRRFDELGFRVVRVTADDLRTTASRRRLVAQLGRLLARP